MSRLPVLAGLLGGVVAIAGAGYLAGTRVQSAAETAARTSPPPPSVITVPVERRVLSTEVITRGTVQFGAAREVTLPSSSLKAGSRIVTATTPAGTEVKEGDVALAISGRPVFILQGAQPAYRDLGPGTSGADVRQLEAALVRLGFDPGPVDGLYDEATGKAVERWYASAGWSAQGPSLEQIAAWRAAETDSRQGGSERLDAEESVRAARAALDGAAAKLRLAELGMKSAQSGDAAATATKTRERLAAEADVARLEGALTVALAEARAAELLLNEARDGLVAPATASELAVLEAEVGHAGSLVTLSKTEIDTARTTARENYLAATTEAAAKRRVAAEALRAKPPDKAASDNARAEADAAQARADAVTRTGAADEAVKLRALDAAEAQLAVVRARLADARSGRVRPASPGELAGKTAAVAAANRLVATATNDLSAARATLATFLTPSAFDGLNVAGIELDAARLDVQSARIALQIADRRALLAAGRPPLPAGAGAPIGFQIPADEILFFPVLPLRLGAARVRVGDRVEGPVLTVSTSRLVASGAVNAADAKAIRVGAAVRIELADLGVTADGSVTLVAESPGTQGVDAQRFYIEITPAGVPASIAGASVVLTIAITSTAGEVLAVPVGALSVGADGVSRVHVQSAAGGPRAVAVRPGLAARGLVEVAPISATLNAGDLVVVGASPTEKRTSK